MKKKKSYIFDNFAQSYFEELENAIESIDVEMLEKAAKTIIATFRNGKKIFIIGNGGSASTASHFTCDLSKGTVNDLEDMKEKRLQVISLSDNTALLSAIANDLSYEVIFTQQLISLARPGDLLIVISGSGNSKNILHALYYAKKNKVKTIGFLGFKKGGQASSVVDIPVCIQSNYYGPIEDMQLIIAHLLSAWIARVKDEKSTANKNKAKPY